MSNKPVGVVVNGQPDPEPSEDSPNYYVCFDSLSAADQAVLLKALGGLDKIRSNPAFNDC